MKILNLKTEIIPRLITPTFVKKKPTPPKQNKKKPHANELQTKNKTNPNSFSYTCSTPTFLRRNSNSEISQSSLPVRGFKRRQ